MISKTVEVDGEVVLTFQIHDDEDAPVVIEAEQVQGSPLLIPISQGQAKAIAAWLNAACSLQRWC